MLRRMKIALAEAESKNQIHSFQATDQNHSLMTPPTHQNSMNHNDVNFKNLNSTFEKSKTQNSWQNSSKKGTVKADEDFEFQGFPKPPPQFFPPPPPSLSNTTQTVHEHSSPSGPSISPNKEYQDHQPIEIKRIPLIFKGSYFHPRKLPTYADHKNPFSAIANKSRLQK